MLGSKINNLYNFLNLNYMRKESRKLFEITKEASENYLNANNEFVYIINYYNEEYSIYYCGKAKYINRRMGQHKMGLGPHIIGKLTDYNWNKRISEIFIFKNKEGSKLSDNFVENIENKISKILNGVVNHSCVIEFENQVLEKTLNNIRKDAEDEKTVLVLGGGFGQNSVSDDYSYIGEDSFSSCEDIKEEYGYLIKNKDSYNESEEIFFSGDSFEVDRAYLESLKSIFSSNIVDFEDIVEGTNSRKSKGDTSLLKEHLGSPSSNSRNGMFKILQFGRARPGSVDRASITMEKIKIGEELSAEEIDFLKKQIYNVLFNYMLHLRNCYRGILLMNFAISFGNVNIKRLNFFVSTEEIKKYISYLLEDTYEYIIKLVYEDDNLNNEFFNKRRDFLKFINFIIINKNQDFVIKEFKDIFLKNDSCKNYFEEEIKNLKDYGGENEISFAIESLMKISSGKAFDSFTDIDPKKTSFHFYGKMFDDIDYSKERSTFLKHIKKIYKIKNKNGLPYGQDENLKNLVINGLVEIIKENYELSKNSVESILRSENLYNSIYKSFSLDDRG